MVGLWRLDMTPLEEMLPVETLIAQGLGAWRFGEIKFREQNVRTKIVIEVVGS